MKKIACFWCSPVKCDGVMPFNVKPTQIQGFFFFSQSLASCEN